MAQKGVIVISKHTKKQDLAIYQEKSQSIQN